MSGSPVDLEDFTTDAQSGAIGELLLGATAGAEAGSAPGEPAQGGYEQGYQAGWEDAVRAEAEDQARIGAALANAIQDLGFTFYEARSQLLRSFRPLLDEIVGKLFPDVLAQLIGPIAREELLKLAEEFADAPLQIKVAPESRPAVERLVAGLSGPRPDVIEEPSLGPGGLQLRAGRVEREIDLSGAIERISSAVNALYDTRQEQADHDRVAG